MAEEAALDAVDGDATRVTFVRPTFIYGGDSFGLFPPRVNTAYGSGVEELLSSPPLKLLAGVAPGLAKIALRPPVSVDAVAACCAAAVLGELPPRTPPSLDGTAAIKAAAGEAPATGLSEALSWAGAALLKALEWVKLKAVELKKE